jgi:endonuclease/exonuclease/phosphatase family metal-dependent hydrolase
MTIICGDFNTRVGDRKPTMEEDHPARTAADKYICTRAPWFLQLCTLYQYYILNGVHSPAEYTFHSSRGDSAIDYILANTASLQVHQTSQKSYLVSDHDLLTTHIPFTASTTSTPPTNSKPPAITPATTPSTRSNQLTPPPPAS